MQTINKNIVILYNQLSEKPKADELDVIEQLEEVKKSLIELGYSPYPIAFSIDITKSIELILAVNPCFIFNLVESVDGKNELISLSPLILNHLNIPYSGSSLNSIFITTNKLLTKNLLKSKNIRTPDWFLLTDLTRLVKDRKYIVKPVSEDGSVKLDEDSVFAGNDEEYISKLFNYNKKEFFIEEFIDGRELNISVLGGKTEPEVLPPAEIHFVGYPEGKYKIVGYKAKWEEDAFEYVNTPRSFEFAENDNEMLEMIKQISVQCWKEFEMRGYTRIDFRVDKKNQPFVLEINANPCITPFGGFISASQQAGYSYTQIVERIINDTLEIQK